MSGGGFSRRWRRRGGDRRGGSVSGGAACAGPPSNAEQAGRGEPRRAPSSAPLSPWAQGLELPYACRLGCCTACAVKVKSGEMWQPHALGISRELKEQVRPAGLWAPAGAAARRGWVGCTSGLCLGSRGGRDSVPKGSWGPACLPGLGSDAAGVAPAWRPRARQPCSTAHCRLPPAWPLSTSPNCAP